MTSSTAEAATSNWFDQSSEDVAAQLGTDVQTGLDPSEVSRRLAEHGPNSIVSEPPPSLAAVALLQLKDSMNSLLNPESILLMKPAKRKRYQ